jgi:2,3-bisphosphoglycerate-dependent phosphoglycerate mutase
MLCFFVRLLHILFAMGKLILLRHGQSVWNKLNIFTGWVDVPLSRQGVDEALRAGEQLKDEPIDLIFTSTLVRASMTAFLAMCVHSSGKVPVVQTEIEWAEIYGEAGLKSIVPVVQSWQLNERMYGVLQGCNKAEMAQQYGAEQVQIWRRSFDVAPPQGESLKMTAERTLPYFDEVILPEVKQGKSVLVAAHGNSLRSIIMELDALSPEQVVALEVPLGEPIIYRWDGKRLVK